MDLDDLGMANIFDALIAQLLYLLHRLLLKIMPPLMGCH